MSDHLLCDYCSRKTDNLIIHKMNNHIAEILTSLYLGSYGMSQGDDMEYFGITDVINTAFEISCPKNSKYNYFHLQLKDTESQHLLEYLDNICDYIHMLINNKCKVLVHCYMGISRSPSIIIAYLIKYNNMDYDTAYKHVSNKRHININSWFISELKEFEKMHK